MTYRIHNAGLILVWPFLPSLFENLGLLKNTKFKSISESLKAVSVMNYIEKGSIRNTDNNCWLNRLLCNVPFDTKIKFEILTLKEKNESDEVLRALIHHWKELNETSISGLRESFIKREGILKKTDTCILNVHYLSIDILLESLPWSISLIKLPWMENILTVNWHTGK